MAKEVKPISPKDIMDNLETIIPSIVIESVNRLLKDKYRGTGSVSIKQDEIINEIIANYGSRLSRQEIFDKKWLDFESLYRKNGWKVEYDKPAYNENYDAYFKFSADK